jgi:hypothetical protein
MNPFGVIHSVLIWRQQYVPQVGLSHRGPKSYHLNFSEYI